MGQKVCDVVTVPFAVGGGIGSIEDMQELFKIGVNKVSINTAAVKNPDLIKQAVKKFGRGKIVVAIDGKRIPRAVNHRGWRW